MRIITPRKFHNISTAEGVFFAIMVATAESYALYYFTKQGLTSYQMALFSTLPLCIAAIAGLIVPALIQDHNLKKGIVLTYLTQLLGLLGLIYCTWWENSFAILLTSLTLYWCGGLSAGPLWLDWMTKHINSSGFATFFSKRSVITTCVTLLVYLCTSFYSKSEIFFKVIFIIGFGAKLLSLLLQSYLMRSSTDIEPHLEYPEESECSSIEEKPLTLTQPIKLLLVFFFWSALFRLTVFTASPFFLPYMINELKFSTSAYVFMTSVPMLARVIYTRNWGRVSKGFGAIFSVQVCCFFAALVPTLWTFSTNYYYLVFLQFMTGFFWGGLELSTILVVQNLAYSKSRKLVGIQQALATCFSLVGALLGASIFEFFKDYFTLFHISTGARLVVSLFFIYHLAQFKIYQMRVREGFYYLTMVLSIRPMFGEINKYVYTRIKKKPLLSE